MVFANDGRVGDEQICLKNIGVGKQMPAARQASSRPSMMRLP